MHWHQLTDRDNVCEISCHRTLTSASAYHLLHLPQAFQRKEPQRPTAASYLGRPFPLPSHRPVWMHSPVSIAANLHIELGWISVSDEKAWRRWRQGSIPDLRSEIALSGNGVHGHDISSRELVPSQPFVVLESGVHVLETTGQPLIGKLPDHNVWSQLRCVNEHTRDHQWLHAAIGIVKPAA